METVHEILKAHRSGISRPGLLAWARLRIDPAMTEAQLEEELARLGDEVVDVDGFLYLRSYVDPSRQPGRVDIPPGRRPAAEEPSAWPPPPARGGSLGALGPVGKLVGVGVFLWWIIGFVGGLVGGEAANPEPTTGATPAIGEVVGWQEIRVGDCLLVPQEDVFTEVRRVPCDTPHGGEVFAIVDHPGGDYPDDEVFSSFVTERCEPVFETWTGTAFDAQDQLGMSWFTPTAESWATGDRTVLCYLYLADGSEAERSYRTGF